METLTEKKILGFTEEINTCDCCGKQDLKGTYAIDFDGEITYMGSVCAFKVHSISYEDQNTVKKEYKRKLTVLNKFNKLESELNNNIFKILKLLKYVELHKNTLDFNSFIIKYGKLIEETKFYKAYEIGHVVKMIYK